MSINSEFLWEADMPFLRLEGEGSRAFLHGQTTVDVLSAEDESFIQGCWLNSYGRMRGILEIRSGENFAEVLVIAGDGFELHKRFDQVIFPADKVRLNPLAKVKRVQLISSNDSGRFEGSFWCMPGQDLPSSLASLQRGSKEDFQNWRLRKGLPIGCGEINNENNPLELGLLDLISLSKGCYLGQETIAKLIKSGKLKKQLRFWESQSQLEEGQKLYKNKTDSNINKSIGLISSSINQGVGFGSIGLAIINREALIDKELRTEDPSELLQITLPESFISI